MNEEFLKNLKKIGICYLSELPSKDIKVEENKTIVIPGEKPGQFKLYTWYEDKWVMSGIINKSEVFLKELKDAYDDLSRAVKKLTKIAANIESDEMSLKLSKITTKILQAKYELSDDVIDQFEKTKD